MLTKNRLTSLAGVSRMGLGHGVRSSWLGASGRPGTSGFVSSARREVHFPWVPGEIKEESKRCQLPLSSSGDQNYLKLFLEVVTTCFWEAEASWSCIFGMFRWSRVSTPWRGTFAVCVRWSQSDVSGSGLVERWWINEHVLVLSLVESERNQRNQLNYIYNVIQLLYFRGAAGTLYFLAARPLLALVEVRSSPWRTNTVPTSTWTRLTPSARWGRRAVASRSCWGFPPRRWTWGAEKSGEVVWEEMSDKYG